MRRLREWVGFLGWLIPTVLRDCARDLRRHFTA